MVFEIRRMPGLATAQAGNTHTMTDNQITNLHGVTRFAKADETDPVQRLWRLQNEARKQPEGLPDPAG